MLAAVGGWRFARASAPVSGPIVLISVDALRADRLPIYGDDGADTPAIDALAADGVVFDRAYTHAPSTLPSHAALMTGRLPFRTGVRGDAGFRIEARETVLAEILRDRAYATAAVVSSYTLRRDTGIAQGFTFFDDAFSDAPWSGHRAELQRDGTASQQIAEDWLESAGAERAFLFLHLNDPEEPRETSAAGSGRDTYDSEVAYVDQVVGDMIEYLKSNQLYDQSTVILLSDHGEGLGDHGEQGHGLLVYDEALRVPLVIKPAASENGGRRISDVVLLVDLLPTIVDLAKAPMPDQIDGQSLTALLDGTGRLTPRLAYAESLYGRHHFGWSEIRTITDGRYRFISAPREELYDLETDPDESRNIVDAEPEVANRLRSALLTLTASDPIHPPVETAPRVRARLAALGLVGYRHSTWRPASAGRGPHSDAEPRVNPVDRIEYVETYRHAVALFADGHWLAGVSALERLARNEPNDPDLWWNLAELASDAGRYDLASEAYRRVHTLRRDALDAALGAATASFRLRRHDEAARRARAILNTAGEPRGALAARAYEVLARVALARHDPASARAYALEGQNADPRLPLVAYIEGRVRFDQGGFTEALSSFEEAIAALEKGEGGGELEDVRFHAGESLAWLERSDEAASLYEAEIAAFPGSAAARAALARLHHTAGRPEEAASVLNDLVRFIPTPDTYNLAARLWTTFGDAGQAAAVRAEAVRLFTTPVRPLFVHQ